MVACAIGGVLMIATVCLAVLMVLYRMSGGKEFHHPKMIASIVSFICFIGLALLIAPFATSFSLNTQTGEISFITRLTQRLDPDEGVIATERVIQFKRLFGPDLKIVESLADRGVLFSDEYQYDDASIRAHQKGKLPRRKTIQQWTTAQIYDWARLAKPQNGERHPIAQLDAWDKVIERIEYAIACGRKDPRLLDLKGGAHLQKIANGDDRPQILYQAIASFEASCRSSEELAVFFGSGAITPRPYNNAANCYIELSLKMRDTNRNHAALEAAEKAVERAMAAISVDAQLVWTYGKNRDIALLYLDTAAEAHVCLLESQASLEKDVTGSDTLNMAIHLLRNCANHPGVGSEKKKEYSSKIDNLLDTYGSTIHDNMKASEFPT